MYTFLLLWFACTEKSTNEEDTADSEEEIVEEVSDCALLELEEIPFSTGSYLNNYGQIAEDFTVTTLDGEWNFEENWSGCDSYLFINHHSGYDYPNQIWNSSVRDLLDASPRNVFSTFCGHSSLLIFANYSEILMPLPRYRLISYIRLY